MTSAPSQAGVLSEDSSSRVLSTGAVHQGGPSAGERETARSRAAGWRGQPTGQAMRRTTLRPKQLVRDFRTSPELRRLPDLVEGERRAPCPTLQDRRPCDTSGEPALPPRSELLPFCYHFIRLSRSQPVSSSSVSLSDAHLGPLDLSDSPQARSQSGVRVRAPRGPPPLNNSADGFRHAPPSGEHLARTIRSGHRARRRTGTLAKPRRVSDNSLRDG